MKKLIKKLFMATVSSWTCPACGQSYAGYVPRVCDCGEPSPNCHD